MRADLLHVIGVYSNPMRWENRRKTQKAFEQQMLAAGVQLTTVECAYGERPFELEELPGINRVRVRSRTTVWNKENLQNLGIQRLPESAKYIGLFDADISFRKGGWAAEIVHSLQHYHVIQPWEHCYDLGPNDEHLQAHDSFLKLWWHNHPVAREAKEWWTWEGGPYRYAHTGYAWCYTRQAIEWLGGMLEIGALGAGDHHMAHGLVGKAHLSLPAFVSAAYKRYVLQWEQRAVHHINLNLGFLPGTIEHQWHGRKEDRKYVSRWDIIKAHDFDPDTDLKKNTHGVIELTGNKPYLTHDLDMYFRQRNEDANSM